MIQFAALKQRQGFLYPFTYIPVRFPSEWLLSATAVDERRPINMRAVGDGLPQNQDERKTVASSDSAGSVPNEKITNVP